MNTCNERINKFYETLNNYFLEIEQFGSSFLKKTSLFRLYSHELDRAVGNYSNRLKWIKNNFDHLIKNSGYFISDSKKDQQLLNVFSCFFNSTEDFFNELSYFNHKLEYDLHTLNHLIFDPFRSFNDFIDKIKIGVKDLSSYLIPDLLDCFSEIITNSIKIIKDFEDYWLKIDSVLSKTSDSMNINTFIHSDMLINTTPSSYMGMFGSEFTDDNINQNNIRESNTGDHHLEIQKVEFSAIVPKNLIKGDYTIINVVMYEKAFRHIVDKLEKEYEEPVQEARKGTMNVESGSKIKVILSSPDLSIDDNIENGIWNREYLNFSFAVFLPEEYSKRQILFFATIYVNDVIATKLKFIVKCQSNSDQKISVNRRDFLSAFVSYASQDRQRVASIIQGMKKARPDLDIFFDVESLRSGENWKEKLFHEIDMRDILFLCWSHFAQSSEWVDREWKYALNQKGLDNIEPIPIESPDICPPPKELKSKHFNDKLLFIINTLNE